MKKILMLFAFVVFLTACTSSVMDTNTFTHHSERALTMTATATGRVDLLEKSRLTQTAQSNSTKTTLGLNPSLTTRPSFTLRPISTPSPIPTIMVSPSPTPTFHQASVITSTPASPAECPGDSAGVDIPILDDKSPDEFETEILDLLNAGALRAILSHFECRYSTVCLEKQIASQDLTGDGVPELIVSGGSPFESLFVFGCQEGKYVTLLEERPEYEYGPSFIEIRDMNLNGMNDLVIEQITCHWCLGIRVYEWRKDQFYSLVWNETYPGTGDYYDIAELPGYSSAEIVDMDENGTYEIVLEGGIPSWPGGLWGFDGPYRSQTVIYSWNGAVFSQRSQEYESPRFRFEAVQDGDTASELGEFDKALAFYQDAISSNSLSSWTNEEWFAILNDPERECCTLPDPSELPFSAVEYAQLSAYSRYRIMLLHLLQGREKEAQIVYGALVEKFPVSDPGYPYVQLATEFWNEYQLSSNVSSACLKAIDFARQHEEILLPLGNNHGMFSKPYKPETICPFK